MRRILRWTDSGLEYEADQRHAEVIVEQMCLDKANPVSTPGTKCIAVYGKSDELLSSGQASIYRALVARANYLAQDRPDIQYSVKELCREMSTPSQKSWESLKRLGRYLKGRPRMIQHYPWQSDCYDLHVYVDSDFAGCLRTRKSTSGGCISLGSHVVKTWSTTQAIIALSSGEAEYYGIVRGASLGMGVQSVLQDLGVCQVKLRVHTDSSAAIGIASRTGLGKTRHIAVHNLWVQERVRRGDFILSKVLGLANPADLLTKHLDHSTADKHCSWMKIVSADGRSAIAPAAS